MVNKYNEIVRLLINGHPIGNIYLNGMGYWEAFPVDIIKKIEIIRGPGSSLYGNNAMVGEINIVTKNEDDKSFFSESYGTFGTFRGNCQITHRENKFGALVFADYYKSDPGQCG